MKSSDCAQIVLETSHLQEPRPDTKSVSQNYNEDAEEGHDKEEEAQIGLDDEPLEC